MSVNNVPDLRIRKIGDMDADSGGDYVLYWMISFRCSHYNFSVQRAVE